MMKLTIEQLRSVIRHIIVEDDRDTGEELLLEPDEVSEDEEPQDESSAAGVAGFTLPLGMSPPGRNRKKSIKSWPVAETNSKTSKPL